MLREGNARFFVCPPAFFVFWGDVRILLFPLELD